MTKRNQMRLLRQCAFLFALKRTCNEPSVVSWLRIVFAAHRLGYLYCGFKDDLNIDVACIAYRVRELTEESRRNLPEKEDGETLYVSAIASVSKEPLKLWRLLKWYLKNNLEIKYVAYDYRNTDNLKIHSIRSRNGKIVKTKLSSPA